MAFSAEVQGALFRARERRRRRRLKAGAGIAPPALRHPYDAGEVAGPVDAAQRQAAALVTRRLETLGAYPAGALLQTGTFGVGGFLVQETDAGVITVSDLQSLQVRLSADLAPLFTPDRNQALAFWFDPPNDRLALFVNGDLVGDETFAHTEWAAADWANTPSAVSDGIARGAIEVFPGFIPPALV